MRATPRRSLVVAVALSLLGTACGGGDDDGGGEPKSAIGKVKEAIIQVDVTGTFAQIDGGTAENQEGRGTGFVISEDGVAVTNNHVVTGATKIQVRVPGKDEPVSAKVLGASECADLAVIDLEGDGYRALNFAEQAVDIGDAVEALGYPLGVRELTLKKGVVEKVKGPKATDWAAVPGVMQHSAVIEPGNSGGPLVNSKGDVVGINYAGGGGEYYAITAAEAQPIVAKLRKGEEVDSLGINSQAISIGEETGGVFIASMATGSPPDRLGVRPGDVLLRLEEQPLALDGTMSDYCDVLHSRDTKKPLRVGLIRLESEDQIGFYTGTLNGAEAKLVALDIETGQPAEGGGAPPAAPAVDLEAALNALPDGAPFSGFTTLTDDTGSLIIQAPVEYGQVEKAPSNPLTGGGRPLPHIGASPDFGTFRTVSGSGTSFYVFPNSEGKVQAAGLLEAFSGVEGCTFAVTNPFPNELFDLYVQYWVGCKGTPTIYVRTAAQPIGLNPILVSETVATTKADLVVLLQSLITFDFDPAAFDAWKAANPSPPA